MIQTLKNQDTNLDFITASKKDIIDSITLEDVKNFLESLGVTQIMVNKEKQYSRQTLQCYN